MTFPDGRIKDGFFENNVFKGNTQVQEGSQADKQIKNEEQKRESRNDSITRDHHKDVIVKTRGNSNSLHRE